MENNGYGQSQDRNAERNPRANSIRLSKATLQFVLAQKPITYAALIVPASDPFTKFLIRLVSELVGVSLFIHGNRVLRLVRFL